MLLGISFLGRPRFPELARRISAVMADPSGWGRVRRLPGRSQSLLGGIAVLIRKHLVAAWDDCGSILSRSELRRIDHELQGRLAAIREIEPSFLLQLKRWWHRPWAWEDNTLAYPRLWKPAESAASFVSGLGERYARWGYGGFIDHDFLFLRYAKRYLLPSQFRHRLGRDVFVQVSPGTWSSAGGIDYHLVWHGRFWRYRFDVEGRRFLSGPSFDDVVVARVGVVRRRDGFAITEVQGGEGLAQIRIKAPGSKDRLSLIDRLRETYGNWLEWLARQVLRDIHHREPRAVVYWMRGDRQGLVYDHLEEISHNLRDDAGHLGLSVLRRRVSGTLGRLDQKIASTRRRLEKGHLSRSRREATESLLGNLEEEARKARHMIRVIKRYDDMAGAFGFRAPTTRDAWHVLRPHDPIWVKIMELRPTDLPLKRI